MCAACPTPRLNLRLELHPSSNKIHDMFPLGPRRIQQNYLVSDTRLRREERAPTSKGVQPHLRVNQGSRESRHCQFRFRERADTTGPAFRRADTASSGFKREPTPPVQLLRERRHCQFRDRESADHRVEVYASGRSSSGTSSWLGCVFTQLIPTHGPSKFEFPKCGEQ